MSETRITHVIVVVPARNEGVLIGACLAALRAAVTHSSETHPDVILRTVVVADACTDETERIAVDAGGIRVVATDAGRVGLARELGIATGLADFPSTQLERIWIANTDADSVVPENWITHQLGAADAGSDVVVGTVRPDPEDLTEEQNAAWLRSHRRGHPNGHVHGANLGLRASVHARAGGFEPVDEHEDNLLVDRLRLFGVVIEASDRAEVVTSGRFVGRTPGGYAAHLASTL